jgi:hypothetical protein
VTASKTGRKRKGASRRTVGRMVALAWVLTKVRTAMRNATRIQAADSVPGRYYKKGHAYALDFVNGVVTAEYDRLRARYFSPRRFSR